MNIKYNSKEIKKGDIFIALRTNNDGHKYVNDAIANIPKIIKFSIGIFKNSPVIPKNGIITIIGTNIILNIVNLFGKFIV